MESLPLEILIKIVSNLNLEDQIRCCIVSTRFKTAIDDSFKSLTHLALPKIRIEDSILFPEYLNGKFVHCNLKYSSDLSLFLYSNCPHLQVLYVPYSQIKLEELKPLGASLKFFYCLQLYSEMTIDQIVQAVNCFTLLDAFFCSFGPEKCPMVSSLLMEKLFNEEKQVFNLVNPSIETLQKIYDTVGFSCLRYIQFTRSKILIPEDVAQNLRCLLINNKYKLRQIRLEAPLSNLKYLYSSHDCKYSNEVSDKLFASHKLKAIICSDRSFPFEFMSRFLPNLHIYEQLECIRLNLDRSTNGGGREEENGYDDDPYYPYIDEDEEVIHSEDYSSDDEDYNMTHPGNDLQEDVNNNHTTYHSFKLSLPANLKIFTAFKMQLPLEIASFHRSSLRVLICKNLLYLQGEFPHLEILKIRIGRVLKQKWMEMISSSLSTCVNLRHLEVTTKVNTVQPIPLDSLRMLDRLEHFSYHFEEKYLNFKSSHIQNMLITVRYNVYLPANIKVFRFFGGNTPTHLIVNNNNFMSLRRLVCTNLSTLEGEFPHLNELNIDMNSQMCENDAEILSHSISGCVELKSLVISIKQRNNGLVHIQPIMDSIESLNKLKRISFTYNDFFEYEKTIQAVKVRLGGVKLILPCYVKVFNSGNQYENPDITGRNSSSFKECESRNLRAFKSHVPYLEELKIHIRSQMEEKESKILSNFISSCVKLKSLVIDICKNNGFVDLKPIMDSIESLNKLERVSFRYNDFFHYVKSKVVNVRLGGVKVTLPCEVRVFDSDNQDENNDITGLNCSSFIQFPGLNLRQFKWNLPRLEELEIDVSVSINENDARILSKSISMCNKLRSLVIKMRNNGGFFYIQPIMESIEALNKLKNVSFCLGNFFEYEKTTKAVSVRLGRVKVSLQSDVKVFKLIQLHDNSDLTGRDSFSFHRYNGRNLRAFNSLFPHFKGLELDLQCELGRDDCELLSSSISSCIELRHLTIPSLGNNSYEYIESIVHSIKTLDKLETFSAKFISSRRNEWKHFNSVKIFLPLSIKAFEAIGFMPGFSLSGHCTGLRKIVCENLCNLEGYFPCLEELNIKFIRKMTTKEYNILSHFIFRCIELKSLVISFSVEPDHTFVQSIMESLRYLYKLDTVSLDYTNHFLIFEQEGQPVLIDKSRIARILNFNFSLPLKIEWIL